MVLSLASCLIIAAMPAATELWLVDQDAGVPSRPDESLSPAFVIPGEVYGEIRALQLLDRAREVPEVAQRLMVVALDRSLPELMRTRAVTALAMLESPKAVPVLIELSRAAEPDIARVAVDGLGAFGVDHATHDLERLQSRDYDSWYVASKPSPVATRALIAIATSEGPLVPYALRSLRHHDGPEVDALGKRWLRTMQHADMLPWLIDELRTPEARRFLQKALTAPSVDQRRRAIWTAVEWEDRSFVPLLVDRLTDESDEVAQVALAGLRRLSGMPSFVPAGMGIDGDLLEPLWRRRIPSTPPPLPKDLSMPAAIAAALEARRTDPEGTIRALTQIAAQARDANDVRTYAVAHHRLGDLYADLGDCRRATEGYWRAMVLHEARVDDAFTAVAATDLGLLYRKCGSSGGADFAPTSYRYAVSLRRKTGDAEGLRKALSNLGAELVVEELHDEARTVLAEAIALAVKLGDASGEWKTRLNDTYRLWLQCSERAEVWEPRARRVARPECQVKDGTLSPTPATLKAMRDQLALSVAAAQKVNVDPETVCNSVPGAGMVLCPMLPGGL
jgi:hypothetical protein